jgi:hypothetical protein
MMDVPSSDAVVAFLGHCGAMSFKRDAKSERRAFSIQP